MESNSKKAGKNNMLLAFITLVCAIVIIALVGFFILKPRHEVIQGQVEAKEVRVSGKVPGRIQQLWVEEGDKVTAGDTLAIIYSPEIEAKLEQAKGAHNAAQAQSRKALKGAREEQITSAKAMWEKAKAGLEIAEKSNQRMQNLFSQGVVTAQKKEEAEANYKAMLATERAAFSQYEMAKNGAEAEDRQAAQALVEQAQGAIDEVNSYIKERYIVAPISGIVSEVFPNEGELVGTGTPILNILDKSNEWIVFSLREDYLKNVAIGNTIEVTVPALGKDMKTTVFYLKDMGTYAAWKATKTSGQYDLKTFEVKARPETPLEGLHPGMTVIVNL